jgi:hypothetical protein
LTGSTPVASTKTENPTVTVTVGFFFAPHGFCIFYLLFLYCAMVNCVFQKFTDQLVAAISGSCGNIVDPLNQVFSYPYRESFETVLAFCAFWAYDESFFFHMITS